MMNTFALPTICMAVAPIRCTMAIPHKLRNAAQNMLRISTGTSNASAPTCSYGVPMTTRQVADTPLPKARGGADRPAGSKAARVKRISAAAGDWKSNNCSGVSTGSSAPPGDLALLRPRTERWMATFFSERRNMAIKESAMPDHGCSRASVVAASTPPRIAKMPPAITRATAIHACEPKDSPSMAETRMVMAGVMLPSTALRPGSMRPKDMLFAMVANVCASTTGATLRQKRPTKRRLQNRTPGTATDASDES
mmetsp:Transcript_108195/g.312693  ORF Transcript_108195/g.312693 Transcript_108195/m.312693 type:complete len:253 (+) Transcript_108195:242-1000(+)